MHSKSNVYTIYYLLDGVASQETVLAPSGEAAVKLLEEKYRQSSFKYTGIEKVGARG